MNHETKLRADESAASTYSDDEVTGLPALGSWRAVYAFVVIIFVVYVALLSVLQRVFA